MTVQSLKDSKALDVMSEIVGEVPSKSEAIRRLIKAGYQNQPIADFITIKDYSKDGKVCIPQFPANQRKKLIDDGWTKGDKE